MWVQYLSYQSRKIVHWTLRIPDFRWCNLFHVHLVNLLNLSEWCTQSHDLYLVLTPRSVSAPSPIYALVLRHSQVTSHRVTKSQCHKVTSVLNNVGFRGSPSDKAVVLIVTWAISRITKTRDLSQVPHGAQQHIRYKWRLLYWEKVHADDVLFVEIRRPVSPIWQRNID